MGARPMNEDRALAADLVALSAGLLSGIALAAATLGHALSLVVGIERDASGRTLWRIVATGNSGLASDLRLTDPDFRTLRTALDRAITAAAARAWRVTKN